MGSFELQLSAVQNTMQIDYEGLMRDLDGVEVQSRVIEIELLRYQLERYKGALGGKVLRRFFCICFPSGFMP